jgi:hypothetical protein
VDVATYWADLKSKAKDLTGVEKIKMGLLSNKSGVAKKLQEYVDAKPAKKDDAALAAIKALDHYKVKIHNVELKAHQKKKVFTEAQLQSMEIVDKGLEKIKKALAASIGGDGKAEMKHSGGEDATWLRYKDGVLGHVELRKRAVQDMADLKADFQERIKKLAGLGTLGKGALARLKTSKQQGDMHTNLVEMANLQRAMEEARQIYEEAEELANQRIRAGTSMQMKARSNCPDFEKLPDDKQKKYDPELNRLLDISWKTGQQNEAFVQKMKQAADAIGLLRDSADNFSMQGIDPAKYLERMQKLDGDLKRVEVLLSKCDSLKDRKAYQEDMEDRISTYAKGPEDFLRLQRQILSDQEGRITRGGASLNIIANKVMSIPKDLREDPQIKKLAIDIARRTRDLKNELGTYSTRLGTSREVLDEIESANV